MGMLRNLPSCYQHCQVLSQRLGYFQNETISSQRPLAEFPSKQTYSSGRNGPSLFPKAHGSVVYIITDFLAVNEHL